MRKTRIILEAVFFAGITLLFLGIGADWWGWMAKVQFLPSTLRVIAEASALNVGILAGLVVITLLFGRVYCSVICPLGALQDIVIRIGRKVRPKAGFKFSPERKSVRYGFLVLTVAALIAGVQLFVAFIAPYSSYGRIVRGVAGIGHGAPWALILTGVVMLLLIVACAMLAGRIWCNAICPVGTMLGLIGRRSVFRIRIDEDKCVGCGSCARKCKASCIDAAGHKVDASRCVGCFDCIDDCKVGAISYSVAPPKAGGSRRDFLSTGLFLAGAAVAKAQIQGGLADIEPKRNPARKQRILPPGAQSEKHFYDRCTACQLCVTACPNDVLRPSTDMEHLLQPEAGYEKGWCRPECTACADVCPTGAILPLTAEQKTAVHIGTAHVHPGRCITEIDDVDCGNCERHCPTGAIRMVKVEGRKHKLPVVNEQLCIGCGACENLCPVRPVSAITVNGLQTHKID